MSWKPKNYIYIYVFKKSVKSESVSRTEAFLPPILNIFLIVG